MTGVSMENILLSAIVCIEILGLLTWAILSSRASRSSAPAKSAEPSAQTKSRNVGGRASRRRGHRAVGRLRSQP